MSENEGNEQNEKNNPFLMQDIDPGQIADNIPEDTILSEPTGILPFEEVQKMDDLYHIKVYARMPIAFRYGSGEFLYDENGKEYFDFLSGIAVTSLGHAHPDLVEALNSQADLLWHTSNIFYSQQTAQLARALVKINYPGKVFFASTGTEANEAALKLVRAYGQQSNPKKTKVVALKGSFHGRTFGSMSLTGQEKVQSGFGDVLTDIVYVEPDDLATLAEAIDDKTAGVFIEPIMGEGGVQPLDKDFIQLARERCNEESAMLVFDEIQTGVGRTGEYFAWQMYNIQPDVLTMAKGLGGGFPIGAMLVDDRYTHVFQVGMHGSTFGGNHLATRVAYEVIRTIESQRLLEHVKKVSNYLHSKLTGLKQTHSSKIEEVRGMGLLIGVVLKDNREARPIVQKALEKGIVIGRAGQNVLRLAPPLILREHTVDRFIERFSELIAGLD